MSVKYAWTYSYYLKWYDAFFFILNEYLWLLNSNIHRASLELYKCMFILCKHYWRQAEGIEKENWKNKLILNRFCERFKISIRKEKKVKQRNCKV